MKPIKQDLRATSAAHELGVRRPHVHAHDPKRLAAPLAHFFGENGRTAFRPIVSPTVDPAPRS
jgi:hypothetical protein